MKKFSIFDQCSLVWDRAYVVIILIIMLKLAWDSWGHPKYDFEMNFEA